MSDALTARQASEALPGWRLLQGRMHLTVATADFASAMALVDRIGALAEDQQHHPDIELRWGRVHVATSSHDVGGISERDVTLGRAVSAVVEEMGLTPEEHRLTVAEVAIDAMDIPALLPFWAAVLGYDPGKDGVDLTDPDGLGPDFWFQQMDAPREQRNRIHVDVHVAHDEAQARMAKALEAGGRLVSDSEAPSFWVLADPEGNEACICTWQGRE